MTPVTHLTSRPRPWTRRAARVLVIPALLALGVGSAALGRPAPAGARAGGADACAGATRGKPLAALADFPATGLPAGTATVHPEYDLLPPSPAWKHSHGGPVYVYVISGNIKISDEKGTKTYCAGSFFSEPPGHVHTLTVVRQSEIFVLYIMPPGSTRDITAQ